MPTFQEPQITQLSSEAVERAAAFASAVVSTVNYRDSDQIVKQKIQDDHFISKLGEEAVRLVFEQRDCTIKGPDYEIYSGKRKSWEADLKINGVDVAVKTQRRSAAKRYGLSWTFQDSPERRDPILDMPDAWVCLVVYEDLKSGHECVIYPLRKIKQLIFEAPRLSKLVGKKQAVYLETLQQRKVFK